ncbi:S41 family peptidase [Comamonas sp. MYb69]|uniref:S41 family peptidase n=1 Tax=Comamonas sp. MYb69 TaxID=1848650 RepID=UPI0030AC1BE9
MKLFNDKEVVTLKIAFRASIVGSLLWTLAAASSFAQPAGPLPKEELLVLSAAYGVLQRSLVVKPDDRALIVAATKGMLRGADPDSGEYFTADEFEAYRQPRRANLESIGAEVKFRDGRYLLAPLEGSPAAQAGIVFPDQLYAIDGVRIKGLDASLVAEKLAGPPGTTVALTVFRESTLSVHTFQVERKAFTVRGAQLSRLAANVVHLRVAHFTASSLQEAADALKAAWQTEPFQAIVLDLRGCPGGLLDSSVGFAAMFLPKDAMVVRTEGASTESNITYLAAPAFYLRKGSPDPLVGLPTEVHTMPVAVLVDNATSSGAEIVTAALQDHNRAVIIGRPTFGRASIETVQPLQIGGIKFTSSYYFPPSGRKIQGVGVIPDHIVEDASAPDTMRVALRELKQGKE